MAKIIEEVVVIRFSAIVKNGAEPSNLVTDDIRAALEQVAQELIGDGVVVEIESV